MPTQDELKHEAALRAVEYVRDGMNVGLGTGSTAAFAVREIGRRVAEGLQIVGVPTSERTAQLALELGIPLADLNDISVLHVTIDGADEVELTTFGAIKGLGGALLREKLVALATAEEILIVDNTKVVPAIGDHTPIPVEVIHFGWQRTARTLAALGCTPVLRLALDGQPFVSDGHNYCLDCRFTRIEDPVELATRIKSITGVVDHGIFLNIAKRVIVAGTDGVQVFDKE